MKMFKLTKLLDEQGVSVVLGAILVLGIGIAVGSLVYSQYVQSTLHSTEAGFMNDVGGKFVQLQSSISTMRIGDSSIFNLKMNPSFPFFIPTQGEVGTLSANSGAASSALQQLSAKIWNNIGGSSGSSSALNNDNDKQYWEANQVVFSERFPYADYADWIENTIVDDTGTVTPAFDSGLSYPDGISGSLHVNANAAKDNKTSIENAYWERDFGTALPYYPNLTMQAWFKKNYNWVNDPGTDDAIWQIDIENGLTSTGNQTLYAHQETTTISGTPYYIENTSSADAAGTTLSASVGSVGRQLFGKTVYSLKNIQSILASPWTFNYKPWLSTPYVYVGGETVYQGGTSSFANAKAADNLYENIFESDYGTAQFDNYAYVSSYTVTTGSLDNFDNQKQGGGGWSTLSMAYVGTDNNITNGTFTTNDTGWTFGRVGNDALHAWTSSGYANGGSENIYDTQKNVSGEGYIYQSLPTVIPAGSTVSLFYAWLKDYKVELPTQQNIIVTLVRPSGATVDIDSQLGAPAAYNTWYTVNKDISSYFTENGTYQIRMRYQFATPNTNNVEANAKFDEVRIMVNKYQLDVFENVGSIVAGDSYKVQLNFRLDNNKENFRVQVQNASNGWDNFDNVITYSGGSWTTWENNVNSSYIVSNTVRLRFVDNRGKYPLTTNLQLDYVRVKSTTNAVPNFRENVQHNIIGIPSANSYTLKVGYYTAGNEAFSAYLYNFATLNWDNVGVLTGGSSGSQNTFTYSIDSDHISGGNVNVRYVQPDPDGILSSLMVDYDSVAAYGYLENVKHNITSIPMGQASYTLKVGYYTAGNEAFSAYLYNFATLNWDNVGVLTGGSSGSQNTFTYSIDSDHISGGNVNVRYVQPDPDGILSSLMVDYTAVVTPLAVAQASADIIIRENNGSPRHVLASDVAVSDNLTLIPTTLSGNYSWTGYTVEDNADYLEIDYYVDVTTARPGENAYLRIDDSSLAPADQTRVTNVIIVSGGLISNPGVIHYEDSGTAGFDWRGFSSGPITGGVQAIRAWMYAYAKSFTASGSTANLDVWTDYISLLAGPPFWDNVLIGSKRILSPQYVDNVVVTLGFYSKDSGSMDNLYLLENNLTDNWLVNPNPVLLKNEDVMANNKIYWQFVLENDENTYIDNDGIIWLNFVAENDDSPFRLSFDYVNFQVNYKENYTQNAFIQGYYGSSGAFTFKMNLYSFPNQSYIYDEGAVILVQDNTSVMFSQPSLVGVSNIKGDPNNIEVDFNHVSLIGFPPPPITKTGYASIGIKLENEYPVYGPPEDLPIPENYSVVLQIKKYPLTVNAWYNYLINRANYLNTPSENNFFYTKGFVATTGADDNYLYFYITENVMRSWDGLPHILYYERVREVSFSLS